MATENINDILRVIPYLFHRPTEPLLTGRDDIVFKIPQNLLIDRYQEIQPHIETKFFKEKRSTFILKDINVELIKDVISDVSKLGRHEHFSVFHPGHHKCFQKLIQLLLNIQSPEEFFSTCVYIRGRVNPYLFVYAAMVAIEHNEDLRNIPLPANCQIFPELYFDGSIFSQVREELYVVPDKHRKLIEIPLDFTASDLDVEHRVAYWREDIGLNMHHWHWHLVYPFAALEGQSEKVVKKDRRGELFYYMHQQIIARYNFERLSNKLARVQRFNNFGEPIPEGYFSKLNNKIASRAWPSRQAYSILHDVDRVDDTERLFVEVQHVERQRDRIINDILEGFVFNDKGEKIDLKNDQGIDILGNIVEASILSVNGNRYGDLHNQGHLMFAYIHDPDNRHKEPIGIMGTNQTAMRDSIFYRWHAYINDIFQLHKRTLQPYSSQQLAFDGIRVKEAKIISTNQPENEFSTNWQKDDIDISYGLDFEPSGGPVIVRVTHLQHEPFNYSIQIENTSGQNKRGTVRIFLAPKLDERGKEFFYEDQRMLFVELDKFTVDIKPGLNKPIEHKSSDSSVTIPAKQMFGSKSDSPTGKESDYYCKCGWPEYLLIPKGTGEGMDAVLFVMITDAQYDLIDEPDANTNSKCKEAQSYCGLRGKKYPDRRPMGFPFDRMAADDPRTKKPIQQLDQFLEPYPNMIKRNTKIRFTNALPKA